LNLGWLSASPSAKTGYGGQTYDRINDLLRNHIVICIAQLADMVIYGGIQEVEMPNGTCKVVPLTSPPVQIINNSYIPTYNLDAIIGFMDAFGLEYLNHVNVPVIGWIPIDGPFTEKWKHYVRNYYNVIAYSRYGYQELCKFFQKSKIGYIPHSVSPAFTESYDKEKIRQELEDEEGIPSDTTLILNVGANVGPRKELPLMMETFARLIKEGYDAHLYMHTNPYGVHPRGYDLIAWRRILKLEDRVHFPEQNPITNPASNEELAKKHTAADLYTQNSVAEGFGLPIAESMGVGTAVAVPMNSAQTELATAGKLVGEVNIDVEAQWEDEPYWDSRAVKLEILKQFENSLVIEAECGYLIKVLPKSLYYQNPVYVPMLTKYPVPNQEHLLHTWKAAVDSPEYLKEAGKNAREYILKYHSPYKTAHMWTTYLRRFEEELQLWDALRPVFAVNE
jgi:hypothetical protein